MSVCEVGSVGMNSDVGFADSHNDFVVGWDGCLALVGAFYLCFGVL
jgi:hypothetical protein